MENQENQAIENEQSAPAETLTIKFSRKLARPFTASNNKEMVAALTDVAYVPLRNKIAGYITRYLSHPEA